MTTDPTNHDAAKSGPAIPVALPMLSYARPDQYQTDVRRDGSDVVLPHGADLPSVCVKCGQPATIMQPVSFGIATPPYHVDFHVGLCRSHARVHKIFRLLVFCLCAGPGLLSLGLAFLEYFFDPYVSVAILMPPLVSLLVFLGVAVAVLRVMSSPLRRLESSATRTRLGGASAEFLWHLSPAESISNSTSPQEIRENP